MIARCTASSALAHGRSRASRRNCFSTRSAPAGSCFKRWHASSSHASLVPGWPRYSTTAALPSSVNGVITQPAQFSFVHRGRIPQADESSQAWRRATAVAQIAQQDLWESKAADALYFHATYVRPGWARQKVELAQIDTHIFYR